MERTNPGNFFDKYRDKKISLSFDDLKFLALYFQKRAFKLNLQNTWMRIMYSNTETEI